MRVVGIANGDKVSHVLVADIVVAALIEEYGRVVAVVYRGIAHQFAALLPAATRHILLGIAGRKGLDEAEAVERLHILLRGCHVHPAEHVAVAAQDEAVAVVRHPFGNGDAHGGPFIGGALCEALHLQHAVVKVYHAVLEGRLAESRPDALRVAGLAIGDERRLHSIEVAISPRPEVHVVHGALRLECHGVATRDVTLLSVEGGNGHAVHVCYVNVQAYRLAFLRAVHHLRLHMARHLLRADVVVAAIDVNTRSAYIAVERQRLIDGVGHVQPHPLVDAAVVAVEVLVVPLEGGAGFLLSVGTDGGRRLLVVVPVIVYHHGKYVFLAIYNIRCEVEAEGHHAILGPPQVVTVDEHLSTEACSLKFYEYLLALGALGQAEILAIPHHGVGELSAVAREGLVLVPGIGQRDRLPRGTIAATSAIHGTFTKGQLPTRIEIVAFARQDAGTHQHGKQCHQDSLLHYCSSGSLLSVIVRNSLSNCKGNTFFSYTNKQSRKNSSPAPHSPLLSIPNSRHIGNRLSNLMYPILVRSRP